MRTTITAAVPLLLTMLSGCASVQQNADLPSLDGTAWVLSDLPGRTLAGGRPATLRFEGGRVAGSDGCNQFGAPYTAADGTLAVSDRLVSTQMACAPEVMQQAQAFVAALTGAKRYRAAGGGLELQAEDGRVLARFSKQVLELAGTSWAATGINNGRGGVASVVAGSRVTLAFGTDGRATGSAGCNSYVASYTVQGPSVGFGPAAVTRKACADPRVMEQEAAYLNALSTASSVRREGDRLELRTADGALAASFTRDAGA